MQIGRLALVVLEHEISDSAPGKSRAERIGVGPGSVPSSQTDPFSVLYPRTVK